MRMPERFNVDNRKGYAAVLPMSTELLRLVIEDGVIKNYNRQLDWEEVEKIVDPKGFHIIHAVLYHEHVMGIVQPPENHQIRAKVLIKVKDQKEPVGAGFIDVNVVLWNDLAAFFQRVAEAHQEFLNILERDN